MSDVCVCVCLCVCVCVCVCVNTDRMCKRVRDCARHKDKQTTELRELLTC
jgi:hypothetical protein